MIEKIVRLPVGDNGPAARLLYGVDVCAGLQLLGTGSTHVVVTSPPYYGLRDYGTGHWEGGDSSCDHKQENRHQARGATSIRAGKGYEDSNEAQRNENFRSTCSKCGAQRIDLQVGLEETPDAYIARMVSVFREIKRVLRKDGTVWLNLGDSFAGSGRAGTNPEYQERHTTFGKTSPKEEHGKYGVPQPVPTGMKAKDMLGIPFRVAFALQADGWYMRSASPWIKRACMPESCTDRPSSQLEFIFLLAHPESKGSYYYDIQAARAPLASGSLSRVAQPNFAAQTGGEKDYGNDGGANANRSARKGVENLKAKIDGGNATRQRRASDWFFESLDGILNGGGQGLLSNEEGDPLALVVNPTQYAGSHFACFPQKLVEPCILSSTSAHGCCPSCGAQWVRVTGEAVQVEGRGSGNVTRKVAVLGERSRTNTHMGSCVPWNPTATPTAGWEPSCTCEGNDGSARPLVLDPFSGSATAGLVAMQLGRDYVGTDLNIEYLPLAEARILGVEPPAATKETASGDGILDLFGDDS